jgi:hypothetical protein
MSGEELYVHLELRDQLVRGFHGAQIAVALVAAGAGDGSTHVAAGCA